MTSMLALEPSRAGGGDGDQVRGDAQHAGRDRHLRPGVEADVPDDLTGRFVHEGTKAGIPRSWAERLFPSAFCLRAGKAFDADADPAQGGDGRRRLTARIDRAAPVCRGIVWPFAGVPTSGQ